MGAAVFVRKWENRICLFGGGGGSFDETHERTIRDDNKKFFFFLASWHSITKCQLKFPEKNFFSLSTH